MPISALRPYKESFCDFATVQLNGKLWLSGGKTPDVILSKSYFLMPNNFTWVEGPTLPTDLFEHTKVAVNDTSVVIFGSGTSGIWVYNEETGIFDTRNDFEIGDDVAACKLSNFKEIGKDIILAKGENGIMYTYDWETDIWMMLDVSWITPKIVQLFGTLIQIEER